MASRPIFDRGIFAIALGASAPSLTTDAREVYGVPEVKAVTQMLENESFTPVGTRPDTAGKTTAEVKNIQIHFQEFTVPSSGASRPAYHSFMVMCGHKASSITDRTPTINEDTGLRGDGVTTKFRFLTKYAPKTMTHVTDGTQTVTGSAGAWTTGGTGTYDLTTGYVDVTFGSAPADGATITVRYTGGYSLSYDHSRFPQELDPAYIIVTKHQDDGLDEEKRPISGARGNMTLGLATGDVLMADIAGTGAYVARSMTGTAPASPTYTEGADLVWDDNCTVVLYEVSTGGDGKEYVGIMPSIGIDPGFTSEEPRGAVTIGYDVEGRLVAGRTIVTLDLQPLVADELNLEEARRLGTQFNFRYVIPGRASTNNKKVFTARLQVIEIGDAQRGFGGEEQVQVTCLVVTPGNAENPTETVSEPRYRFEVVTT